VLLDAGRPREAATVYWDDLRRHPENGWALQGLARALEAQGQTEQAALVRKRFEKAWARADVTLTASRLLGPVAGD
jgi:predicted Zn-dependent protease